MKIAMFKTNGNRARFQIVLKRLNVQGSLILI